MSKGIFIMFDGLDGIGKGTAEQAVLDYLRSKGKTIFDQTNWERQVKERCSHRFKPTGAHQLIPEHFDVAYTGEPTKGATGRDIRNIMVRNQSKSTYSVREVMHAYALDRLVNYKEVVLPLLEAGKIIVQSRGLPSSLTYQRAMAEEEGNPLSLQEVSQVLGNKLAVEHAPDLLVILTIGDPHELAERLSKRSKKDDSYFEDVQKQLKFKSYFERDDLRELFEKGGTRVVYIDAGVSVEHTQQQAVDAVRYLFE